MGLDVNDEVRAARDEGRAPVFRLEPVPPPGEADAPTDERATPDDGRSRVELCEDLHVQTADVWRAVLARDDFRDVYRTSEGLAHVRRDVTVSDGRLHVAPFDVVTWRVYVGRRVCCEVYRKIAKGLVTATPSRDLCDHMLASAPDVVPVLHHVYPMAVWGGDPPHLLADGYDPGSQCIVDSGPGGRPSVPMDPTPADVETAVGAWRDLLQGFPFAGDAAFAHALALPLTLVTRPLFADSPAPLHASDANVPGTGKTILVVTLTTPVLGCEVEVRPEPETDDEWRKTITSALRERPAIVLFDNVKHKIKAGALNAVLTSTKWTDRELQVTGDLHLGNVAVWTVTGNNIRCNDEIARRTVLISLRTNEEDPSARSGFKWTLPTDAIRHRERLLSALHVMVARWVALGCPEPARDVPALGSFAEYRRIVGGILTACGVPGFLSDRGEVRRRASGDLDEWRTLLRLALAKQKADGRDDLKPSELWKLAADVEILSDVRGTGTDHAQASKFGRYGLAKNEGRNFGGLRLVAVENPKGGNRWRVEPVPSGASGASRSMDSECPAAASKQDTRKTRTHRGASGALSESNAYVNTPPHSHAWENREMPRMPRNDSTTTEDDEGIAERGNPDACPAVAPPCPAAEV